MRQIEKKIKNDLNYVWLVRYVDTIFNLSSSLFDRLQAKNLSLVFVKEKIDEEEKATQDYIFSRGTSLNHDPN